MNKKIIVPALVAIFLATSAPAFSQDRNYQNDRGQYQQQEQRTRDRDGARDRDRDRARSDYQQRDRRDNDRDRGYDRQDRRDRGHAYARSDNRGQYAYGARGAGPRHNLHRGGRLPSEYRSRHYVVNDWRGHRLSAPPRGYHWVQTGGDYVLAAVATGLIAQILLGN